MHSYAALDPTGIKLNASKLDNEELTNIIVVFTSNPRPKRMRPPNNGGRAGHDVADKNKRRLSAIIMIILIVYIGAVARSIPKSEKFKCNAIYIRYSWISLLQYST